MLMGFQPILSHYLAGIFSWSSRFMKARRAALAAQVGVGDGRAILFGGKAAGEARVGPELGWAAVELPRVAQQHPGAAMHGCHHAADLNIRVAISREFADMSRSC